MLTPELLNAPAAPPAPWRATLAAPIVEPEFIEESPRHLREYLHVLHRYRWRASACFAAVVGLALLVTLLVPRLYTASMRLHLARQSPIQLRLEDNVLAVKDDADRNDSLTFLATQVSALKSRDLAERVLRDRRLAQNPAFLEPGSHDGALLAKAGGLPSPLRPRAWNVEPDDGAGGDGEVASVDPDLVDRYMRYLSVRDVGGTDLIEVRFTTPSAPLSAFLAAAHTEAYMESNEEVRRTTDVVAEEFLSQQLRSAKKQISRAETKLRRFAAEHPNVAANQDQKIAEQRIGELSSLLTKAEGTRLTLESRYEFLTQTKRDALPYFLDRPAIQKLRLALLDVRARRAQLDERLGPNHPQMADLNGLRKEIEEQLATEVAREVSAIRAQYGAAQLGEQGLRGKIGQQEELGVQLRGLGARYDMLKKDLESAESLHTSLLKQLKETAVHSGLIASNIRVIERAEVPNKPSRPKIPLNLALGVFGGLVVGVAAAFASDYFDQSVKSSEDVERLLRIPALAAIPSFLPPRPPGLMVAARAFIAVANGDATGKPGVAGGTKAVNERDELVVVHEPWSREAEAFRNMRTALLCAAPASPKVLLVTSARSGEGKTVASLNLASTLAESGARVLLIDADLRHPRCHTVLGIPSDEGLSTFLRGEAELKCVIQCLEAPRVSVLPSGPVLPNPAELLGSRRMREALEFLREVYDFVVIDTPPVLPVTDAVVLARDVDGVVLVVKGQETPREVVRRARDRLVLGGVPFLGVLVNNVTFGWGDLDSYGLDDRYDYPTKPGANGTTHPGEATAAPIAGDDAWHAAAGETATFHAFLALQLAARRATKLVRWTKERIVRRFNRPSPLPS